MKQTKQILWLGVKVNIPIPINIFIMLNSKFIVAKIMIDLVAKDKELSKHSLFFEGFHGSANNLSNLLTIYLFLCMSSLNFWMYYHRIALNFWFHFSHSDLYFISIPSFFYGYPLGFSSN